MDSDFTDIQCAECTVFACYSEYSERSPANCPMRTEPEALDEARGRYEVSGIRGFAQAQILNTQGSEFNVAVGLCVGHDSLFFKHADAPTTVLIVKDRVLGHNPVAGLYLTKSYYQHLLSEK